MVVSWLICLVCSLDCWRDGLINHLSYLFRILVYHVLCIDILLSFRLFSPTLSWPCRCRSSIAILGEAYVGTTSLNFCSLIYRMFCLNLFMRSFCSLPLSCVTSPHFNLLRWLFCLFNHFEVFVHRRQISRWCSLVLHVFNQLEICVFWALKLFWTFGF